MGNRWTFKARPSDPDTTRLQIAAIVRERPKRLAAIAAASIVAMPFLPPHWPATFGLLYFAIDLGGIAVERRMLSSGRRRYFLLHSLMIFVISGITIATPVMLMSDGRLAPFVVGSTIMWGIVIHCVVIRSWNVQLYVLATLPILAGFAAMVPPVIGTVGRVEMLAVIGSLLGGIAYIGAVTRDAFLLKADLIGAKRQADAANRVKDRFLTAISHELRTPLNGILGIAQMMADDARDRAEAERAEILIASGTMLKSLLDDILDHAKMQAGGFTVSPAPADIRHIVRSVQRLFRDTAAAKGLVLETVTHHAVPPALMLDTLRVKQVVSNLVANAIEHTELGCVEIGVAWDAETGRLTVGVRDSGAGIAPDDLPLLFRSFAQLDDASARRGIGTGLGLSISRDLARLMGGDVTVTSELGQGSDFTLSLPAPKAADGQTTAASPAPLAGLRVLVVDDNATNRLIAGSFLERMGARPVFAADGREALKALDPARMDVVLMDIQMPVLDGHAATAAIRADRAFDAIPVIALTAGGGPNEGDGYLGRGFDGFLPKPLGRKAMEREILRVLSSRLPGIAAE
ncbi:hypothetical protein OCGS_1466 [Oceaniovalibus guishaninsula JLT2003]|uniref:histidine kinase n=1 Tax=Oceaniovalibus guishaninsula JLT2003 TaxID=1231392 RepID=K2HAW2_9RHOB|nr:ATP-binding protein [Oceaniovalibus guishaninsula]EKE44628.1 hypothetical protein OCGS_1466 [Oceaniovalibus guishaninsula JLT2003]